MKGKKLPNVWVLIMPGGRPASVSKTKFDFGDIGEEVRYTPAKPAKMEKCKCPGKVCRWPSLEGGIATGCGAAILAHHSYKFCPYCGGKIRTKR